jgi:hypothetical protein
MKLFVSPSVIDFGLDNFAIKSVMSEDHNLLNILPNKMGACHVYLEKNDGKKSLETFYLSLG